MWSTCVFVLTLSLLLLTGSDTGASMTYLDQLELMTDLDQLWRPPVAGERCIQFSSYDRGSENGIGAQEAQPWDPKGWFANIDRGKYLREELRDGKQEYVLADVAGAGVIVRIWAANPTGTLFFYVDGASEPTWSAPFKDLTAGKVPPLVEPFAGERGRGFNCHAPFPFTTHMKVTCSDNDHHYHVNVHLFPKGTKVEPFRPELLTKHADDLLRIGKLLEGNPVTGKVTRHRHSGTLAMTGDPRDPADWTWAAVDLKGPMVIRELALKITPSVSGDYEKANVLRRILLSIALDGRPTVQVPVSDFSSDQRLGSSPTAGILLASGRTGAVIVDFQYRYQGVPPLRWSWTDRLHRRRMNWS